MTVTYKQDINIAVDIPQKDGGVDRIYLQEFDNVQNVIDLSNISKRVVIADTADLIFRLFAKTKNGDADLKALSERVPCLGTKYLPGLQQLFEQPEWGKILTEYNLTDDIKSKRNIRKKATDKLIDYVSQNINSKDLQYNFTKFKYEFDKKNAPFADKMRQAADKIQATMLGFNAKDSFVMAAYKIWHDNIDKRNEPNRKAHWLLIKDSNGKIIGMTFISAKQLLDPRVGTNIIGHSGQILDPSVQGKGYVTAIKSVMVDYMYDNMDENVSQNSLFATTCDEFNENSQGLQRKSGAHVLQDENGNAIIESGKMHWYATKDEIMNSEIVNQAAKRGVKYTVSYANGRPGYTKQINNPQHFLTSNQNTQGFYNDR